MVPIRSQSHQIATALGITHPTVTRVIRIAECNGDKAVLASSDAELKRIFYPIPRGEKRF